MTSKNRPLSPHLQIYRPQLTSVLSILHRATGIVIAVGALGIAWWLWAASGGGDAYRATHAALVSPLGRAALFVWTLCTCYHLCTGVRHLLWDAGWGFELPRAYASGKIALAAAAALTLLAWLT